MKNYLASLVIPTYNKSSRLKLVLESLCYQVMSSTNFEVIIVDDGSTDDTAEVVDNYKRKLVINYIYQKNSGRSHARNVGLDAAKASIVIFFDDDVILSKEFIGSHCDMHQQYSDILVHGRIYELPYLKFFSDPSQGTVIKSEADLINTDISVLTNYLISLEDVEPFEKIEKHKRMSSFEKCIFKILTNAVQHENLHQLDFMGCTGANISGRREIFQKVNGFDESLDRLWGCEDLEMGYRLQKEGVRFVYLEKATNYHITHLRGNYKETLLKSYELFYNKHRDPVIESLPKLLLNEIKDLYEFCNYFSAKS